MNSPDFVLTEYSIQGTQSKVLNPRYSVQGTQSKVLSPMYYWSCFQTHLNLDLLRFNNVFIKWSARGFNHPKLNCLARTWSIFNYWIVLNQHFWLKSISTKSITTKCIRTKCISTKCISTKCIRTKYINTKSISTKCIRTKCISTKCIRTKYINTKSICSKSIRTNLLYYQSNWLLPSYWLNTIE